MTETSAVLLAKSTAARIKAASSSTPSDALSAASGATDDQAHGASAMATSAAEGPDFSAFASQSHTDSYLLFRALCKLSAKTLPEDNAPPAAGGGAKVLQAFTAASPVDPLALSSKILSLELILATLEHCGPAFCSGEKFVYAVQHYLCVSLLKNCMSNHTEVAYLSLKIFLTLVYKFKSHLKSEIEVFVANIFLRILESPNSSYEQKTLVLEALRALCSDPVILTQLFLNYDCDFDAVNLYKDIIQNLTKLSGKSRRNQYNANPKDVTEDVSLSVAGLEVLVVVLRAFLKALGLPGGDDNLDLGEDGSSSGLRGSLKLDVGLALRELTKSASSIKDADDVSVSVSDIEKSAKATPEAMACDHPMMWLGRLSMLLIRSVLHNKTSRLDVSDSRYRSSQVYCILSRMVLYVLTQRKLPSFYWIIRTSSTRHKLVKFLEKNRTPLSSRMMVLRQIRVAKVSLFVYCTTMWTRWNSRTFCLTRQSDYFYRVSVCPERRRR